MEWEPTPPVGNTSIGSRENERKTDNKRTSNHLQPLYGSYGYSYVNPEPAGSGGVIPYCRPPVTPIESSAYSNAYNGQFNIGFVGNAEAGKSTLINALRGLQKNDKGVAGNDRRQIATYKSNDPEAQHVNFHEISYPTKHKTPEQFIKENKLKNKLQYLIIMFSGSIREEDVAFAKAANREKIPFIFIASKCDQDLRSQAHELRRPNVSEDMKKAYTRKARQFFHNELQRYAPELEDIPIYFISATVVSELWHSSQVGSQVESRPEFLLEEQEALEKVFSDTNQHLLLPMVQRL